MYLRRRAQFSAGFLHPPPGGDGGGHNYLCEMTVGGPIDPRSGMVVNIKEIDSVLKAQVTGPLQGRLLDRDIAAFSANPPSLETLTRWIWDRCLPALPPEAGMTRLTLWSSPTLRAELSIRHASGELPMLTVTRTYDFSASHRLHAVGLSDAENADIFGKCNWSNGHGHNYEVEVTLTGEPASKTGLLVDLETLDRIVEEEVLLPFDHRHLNYDVPEFRDLNPTSENLTWVIWNKLASRIEGGVLGGARLYRVAVRETARNYFEYFGEPAVQPL